MSEHFLEKKPQLIIEEEDDGFWIRLVHGAMAMPLVTRIPSREEAVSLACAWRNSITIWHQTSHQEQVLQEAISP